MDTACQNSKMMKPSEAQEINRVQGGVISKALGVEANPVRSVTIALVITKPSNALINKNSAIIVTNMGL